MKKLLLVALLFFSACASAGAQQTAACPNSWFAYGYVPTSAQWISCWNSKANVANSNLTLTNAQIFVGNSSNIATSVAVSGDAAIANTGAITISKIGGEAVALGGATTFSGAHSFTGTLIGDTAVTFPLSGTLATTSTVTFVTCTNTSADNALLSAADTVTAGSIVIYPSTCDIANTLSLTHALQPFPGATFAVTSAKTLTLAVAPIASPQQLVFSGAGSVAITAAGSTVYAEWWGAKANNSTASAPGWQAAANALIHGGTIQGLPGYYQMACASADAVTVTNSVVNIYGSGDQVTNFVPTTNCAHAILTIDPSGQSGNIRDVYFNGSAIGAPYSGHLWTAIHCEVCGVGDISHVSVYGGAIGLQGDELEDMTISDLYVEGCAIECVVIGNGPLDQTGAQHVSIDYWENLKLFNLGNAAGNGIVIDSGANQQVFVSLLEGGLTNGVLMQNSASGTGGARPGNIWFEGKSNFSANTTTGCDVQSAWLADFGDTSCNGTSAGQDVLLGPASVATPGAHMAVDGVAFNGAKLYGATRDEVLIQQAANVSIANSQIQSDGTANTYSAVNATQYALGGLTLIGNWMGSGKYANQFPPGMAYSLTLASGSYADYTDADSAVFKGTILVSDNNMCGNGTGTIHNLGTSPSGAYLLVAPDNQCDTTALPVSRGGTNATTTPAALSNLGLSAPIHPGYVTGSYYAGDPGSMLTTVGAAIASGTLYAELLIPPVGELPTKLSIDVTAFAAGSCHLGVYNANSVAGGAGGTPAGVALNVDAGTVSTGSNAVVEITGITIAPTGGAYWLAALCNATPTLGTLGVGSNPRQNWVAGQTTWGTANQVFGFTATQSYGALPATFPGTVAANVTTSTQPAIAVRP